jgi:mRNA interferase RelE/StbE
MYSICYAKKVILHHIPDLPKSVRKLVERAIDSRLTVAPIDYGKPLQYTLKGHRRIRVGDWRVVYRIDEATKTVYVVAIKHRKDVYD